MRIGSTVDEQRVVRLSQKESRMTTVIRAAAVRIGGRELLCLVRGISQTRFLAEIDVPPGTGKKIALKLGEEWVNCTVSKAEDRKIWCKFNEEIDVDAWLSGRRDAARIQLSCAARLQLGSQTAFCELTEISQSGARLSSEAFLLDGDVVTIMMRGWSSPLRGIVKWSDGTEVGIQFCEALDIHRLMSWVSAAGIAQLQSVEQIRNLSRQ